MDQYPSPHSNHGIEPSDIENLKLQTKVASEQIIMNTFCQQVGPSLKTLPGQFEVLKAK